MFEGANGVGILQEACAGYVGQAIAAKFKTYFTQHGTGLDAKALMEAKDFKKEFTKKIGALCKKSKIEAVQLGNSVATYLHENEKKMMTGSKPNELGKKYASNFYDFLKALNPETRVEVYTNSVETARQKGFDWVHNVGLGCPDLKKLYIELVDIQPQLL